MNRRGQVTIFVIIALVIVGLIGAFYALRGNLFSENIPSSIQPVYSRYSECISTEVSNGIKLMQSQGGRIDIGESSYASDFNPFSTHLNFLGFKIPYWYGFTENNLVIQNVPTTGEMERELAGFVSERLNDCDFSDFYAQGYSIERSNVETSIKIEDESVSVSVNAPLSVKFGDDSAVKNNHELNLDNRLGSLYKSALNIYNSERQDLFFENYALDVLQSYAPVDGVEIQCSPKIWKTEDVIKEIQNGLTSNMASIKFDSSSQGGAYFNRNLNLNDNINIVYLSESFPSKIEVSPATQSIMIAEPVGTQGGMGVMGFCYVPYHFVYDVRFPILVQVGDGVDNFQFPIIVDISKNTVNSGEFTPIVDDNDIDVCAFRENDVTINTYDTTLNPIPANLSYKCFDSLCRIGQTSLGGQIETKLPACVNGYLVASAEGYADSKKLFSSNSESFAELVLDKEYDLDVSVMLANKKITNGVVVHFSGSDGYSTSAILPDSPKVKLKEGLYNIETYIYGNSSIVIPATTKTECFDVSKGGVAGFFGAKTEKCINVEIPSTKIEYALLGGGKLKDYYLLEGELASGSLVIDTSELPKPTSLEQLQYNYEVFNSLGLEVTFQ